MNSSFFCWFQLKIQFKDSVESIRNNEQRASVTYSDLMTFVFENIARELETQQPLVDTYYGDFLVLLFFSPQGINRRN